MNKAPAIKLGIIFLVITISYSFFWFVRTGQTEKKINNLISKNSSSISASSVSVSGFPFSQKITISDLKFNIPSVSKYQVTVKKLEANTGIFSKSFSANILEQVTVFDNDSNTIRNIEFKESPKISISFNNEGISSFNYQDSGYTILEDQKPPFYSSSSNIIKMETLETANNKVVLKFNIDIKDMEGVNLASIYQNVFEKKINEGIKTGEITIGNNINNAINSTLLINPEQQVAVASNQINSINPSINSPINLQALPPIKPELKPAIELGSNSNINNPQVAPQQVAPQQVASNNNINPNINPNNNSGTLNNNQPINPQEAVKIASQSGSPALAQQVTTAVNNSPTINNNTSVVNSVDIAPNPANNAPAIANNINGQVEQPKIIIEPSKQNSKFNLSLDFEYTIINSSEPSAKKENNIKTVNTQPATEQTNSANPNNATANNVNASNGNPNPSDANNIPPVPAVANNQNTTAPTLPEISSAHKSEIGANSGYSIKINNFELSSNEIKFTANGQIDNFIDDNSPSGSVTLKIDKFPSFNTAISSAVESIKSNIITKQNKGLSQQNNVPYDNFLNKINEKLFLILEEISKKNALTKPETAVLEIRREKNLEFIINETPMREVAGKF